MTHEKKTKTMAIPIPAPSPASRMPLDAEFIQRADAMVRGDLPPTNRYVAQCVADLREAQAEIEALIANIKRGDEQLSQMRQRQAQLTGTIDTHLRSIHRWEHETDGAAAEGSGDRLARVS